MTIVGRTLKGSTKSILVAEDAVTISYKAMYHGFVGDKRIPFSSITAIQYKEAGGWLAGYIQFTIAGSIEWRGAVSQDENAVQFDKKEADDFRALRDFIQPLIGTSSRSTLSMADELTKLSKLRDDGVLTDDEFQAQKAKVLKG